MIPYVNKLSCNNDKWVFRKRKALVNEVKLRIFLFPPAGSDISIYQKWENYLPSDVELCLIRLPGRGGRVNEPLIDDISILTSEIANDIIQYFDIPYVFFGHSMGALVAYETAVLIYENGHRLPEKLFLSSLKAPNYMNSKNESLLGSTTNGDEYSNLHLMNDEALKNKLYQIGGIPEIIMKDNSYADKLLPIFRNDLKLCETFKRDDVIRLPVPIDVYGGNADKIVSRKDLEEWKGCSNLKVTITLFPGGHFYFNNVDRFFIFNLSKKLEEVIRSFSDT
jgi:surfactin synthase thioesterase subunit